MADYLIAKCNVCDAQLKVATFGVTTQREVQAAIDAFWERHVWNNCVKIVSIEMAATSSTSLPS